MIRKDQFIDAYNKHLPSKWIKFAYKYFSEETEAKDFIIRDIISYFLLGLLIIGLIGTKFEMARIYIAIPTYIYSVLLISLVLFLFSAVILNNLRINKIRKELGDISKDEYNKLTNYLLT
jgi:hypothetical protein